MLGLLGMIPFELVPVFVLLLYHRYNLKQSREGRKRSRSTASDDVSASEVYLQSESHQSNKPSSIPKAHTDEDETDTIQ